MWCLGGCFGVGKSWIQLIIGHRKPRHAKPDTEHDTGPIAELDTKPERFSYSTVPLRIQRHDSKTSLREIHSNVVVIPKTIRLLSILPTTTDGLLTCHIRTVELDTAKALGYEALSYTWGPTTQYEQNNGMNDEKNHAIVCNNRRLSITENLYNCLVQLERNGHHDQNLWADAICINQGDKTERSQQVSIMADIYRSARRVIVWLGAADKFTRPAWELMGSLSKILEKEVHTINPRAYDDKGNHNLLGSSNTREHWRALALLFGRSWFTRAWVVQELVLAQDTIILCGSYDFEWRVMVSISHFLAKTTSVNTLKEHLFDDLDVNCLSYKNPAKLEAIREDIRTGTGDVLLRSLIRCRTYRASCEHDKVYSLLGLIDCKSYENPGVYPDYDQSIAKVYTDAAKYLLEISNDLHILAHAEGDRFKQTRGLPTWVPDWSVTKDLGLRITGYARYNAAGTLPCFKAQNGDALMLRGFELDTISRVGETKEEVNDAKTCNDWLDLRDELAREYPDRDHKDAFWRTLLIDTDPSGKVPIIQPWEGAFDVWMNLCTHEPSEDEKRRATEYETSFTHSLNLRLFRTARGYLGCGTQSCQDGDLIWIVQGSRVPLILRPVQHGSTASTYNLVGGTYLHGFMQGEALEGREFQEFTLI